MKKAFILIAVFTLVASIGAQAAAVILDGPHDLTTATGKVTAANAVTNVNETCGFCHVPHNGDMSINTMPLWNHAATSGTAAFTNYTSPTLNATITAPGTGSLRCLGCHDGSTALGATVQMGGQLFGAADALVTPTAVTMTGAAQIGLNLSNDHPVGMVYDAALVTADGQLQLATAGSVTSKLVGGRVECGSCHSMHRSVTNRYILRVTMDNSTLCTDCHVK